MALRHQTGIPELDEMLGGGLIPGTLTVVLGATGIGKTQLGIQYLNQGKEQDGATGVLFDMTSRGDSQNHVEYADRMFNWKFRDRPISWVLESPESIWDPNVARWDALHLFQQTGKRVTMSDMNFDEQRAWKVEINRKLIDTIAFFYGNFCQGVRRCVIDGVEPTDRASDSFQFELFEYVYHQILRKEYDWVARDLLRARFREFEVEVKRHAYDYQQVSGLMLCTSHEMMLEALISRPIESGDVFSNANTIILMGKVREGSKMGRALYVAKHRGSRLDDSIRPYEITEHGLKLL
ncbi:RAD55 family ATPase [Planctomicrobium sp. SH668]|uniref:RAD55 family ATPase n=1 Tax=Planctomicrobium sp. SH668 TaxID=3448126 RepID=UPI003F5AF1CC